MFEMHRKGFGFIGSGLALGFAMATVGACDNDPGGVVGDIAEQCGLDINCEAGGFVEGKASISGIPSIDAFFGAAIDLNASMTGLSGSLRAELDAIGASVGLAPGATGAELQAAIDTHLEAYINVDAGLSINYQPAKCEASVEASVAAAAECDVDVEPGMVSAKCEGTCTAEASAEAGCSGEAELVCSGTAPNFECSGTCSGSCAVELTAEASCEGTCRGSCSANGSTMDGFEGNCAGMCMGECVADLSAGGSCEGRCEGNCEYTPGEVGCAADAQVSCRAMANASVECNGSCEGSVEPPEVSAECEASVEAKASASIECTPPTLAFDFEWAASLEGEAGVQARAEFRAWLEGFRLHFGALLAARAKADIVAQAGLNLVAAADGAVRGAFDELEADANLKASIGAACAIEELPFAVTALQNSGTSLAGNVEASVSVIGAFGG